MWKACACLMPLPHRGSSSPYIHCGGWGLRSSQCCVLQRTRPSWLNVSEEQWGQQSVCFGHFCHLPFKAQIIEEEWDDVIKVFSIFVVVSLYALFMTFFFTHREITASSPPTNLLSTRRWWCQLHFWGHCVEELRARTKLDHSTSVHFSCDMVKVSLVQAAHRGCEGFSLGITKSHMDMSLSTLLWVSLLEQRLAQRDPEVPANHSHSVWASASY